MPRLSRSGFTLIELIIFLAIFTGAAIVFISVLISVVRVQVRQSAAAEVNQQTQLLIQTISQNIEKAAVIELATDQPTSTLQLRIEPLVDPTLIFLGSGASSSPSTSTVYIQETAIKNNARLTSDLVRVTSLSFTKKANPPGRDAVAVSFEISFNSNSPQRNFSQSVRFTVARPGPATFDSSISAGSLNTYKIGATGGEWRSINDLIFFSGSNVGIGTPNPTQALEVNGGIKLYVEATPGTCDSSVRGSFVFDTTAASDDNLYICAKNASGTYVWTNLTP